MLLMDRAICILVLLLLFIYMVFLVSWYASIVSGGGGGGKIMCVHAHHEFEAGSPIRPGSRAHF